MRLTLLVTSFTILVKAHSDPAGKKNRYGIRNKSISLVRQPHLATSDGWEIAATKDAETPPHPLSARHRESKVNEVQSAKLATKPAILTLGNKRVKADPGQRLSCISGTLLPNHATTRCHSKDENPAVWQSVRSGSKDWRLKSNSCASLAFHFRGTRSPADLLQQTATGAVFTGV